MSTLHWTNKCIFYSIISKVGRNGSGKSNFLFGNLYGLKFAANLNINLTKALQFVLSKEYQNLNDEQRAALISENVKLKTASVKITFDNSDLRISGIDDPEVDVLRILGSKKDQFYVNSKHVLKSEFYNLLECSGFSPNNPYYIIKQGKVTQFAMANEKERLNTFLDVAGVKIYESKKSEIENDMNATSTKFRSQKFNKYDLKLCNMSKIISLLAANLDIKYKNIGDISSVAKKKFKSNG